MEKVPVLLSLCILANLIHVADNTIVNSNGFTLKLIHPHSSESPFSQSNLSCEERIKRSVYQSNIPSSSMRMQIDVQLFHYIVKIGIGTLKSKPPYKEYYLEMDTGSSLVWMQCEGCKKCFNQTPKPFPKRNSSSFQPVLIDNKPSHYECAYRDGSSTRGVLARETFYLRSNTGGLTKLENLEFGCGLQNDMQYGRYRNNKIAGIMGLGWEALSFTKQLGPRFKGKFSYCLPVVSGKTPSTYLRFGDDIVQHKNAKITALHRTNQTNAYYVELRGISLNKTRLNIKPEVFAIKDNGSSGGCTIDSGVPYSRIVNPAFDALKLELEKYFTRMKGLKKIKRNLGLELCYERKKPEGFAKLPDITFHLQGSKADFVMKAEAVFEVVIGRFLPITSREYFCLAMVRDNTKSIIGAHQQTNQRIIHDTKNKLLVFYPEDCSKNP